MNQEFPSAVPEMPVKDVLEAVSYYENCLGFERQGGVGGGFAQACRGSCRIFLTDCDFRERYGPVGAPVVIWLNLNNKKEVDVLHEAWKSRARASFPSPNRTVELARVHGDGSRWKSAAGVLRLQPGAG